MFIISPVSFAHFRQLLVYRRSHSGLFTHSFTHKEGNVTLYTCVFAVLRCFIRQKL